MRVFLIGYRGAGKSTAGTLLSQALSLPLYSMDEMIQDKAGKSIPRIVEEEGWEGFRKRETELLEKLIENEGIIDCGGGIIEREENRNLLHSQEWVFFLKASIPVVKKRLLDKTDRPSLSENKDFLSEIEEIYRRRMPLYEETAHYTVNADETPEKVVDMIRFLLIQNFPF
jgi:shikimate kinase